MSRMHRRPPEKLERVLAGISFPLIFNHVDFR
jgi:hypothetical protein